MFLHADSDAVFFGYTDNPTLSLTFKCRGSTAIVLVYLVNCNSVLKFIRFKDHSTVLKQRYQNFCFFILILFYLLIFFEIRVVSKFRFLLLTNIKQI